MQFETSSPVAAAPHTLWQVLVDVERWPEATRSMTSVRLLDPGPLRVGSRALVTQPRLPRTEWTVTELVEDERFVWESSTPGMRTAAVHEIRTAGAQTTLRLLLDMNGPLAGVAGRVFGSLTRRYLDLECQGMKASAEARS